VFRCGGAIISSRGNSWSFGFCLLLAAEAGMQLLIPNATSIPIADIRNFAVIRVIYS